MARTPGLYTDINTNTQRTGLANQNHSIVLVTSDVGAPTTPMPIYDTATADAVSGADSNAGRMMAAALTISQGVRVDTVGKSNPSDAGGGDSSLKVNDIGVQGAAMFGIGITDDLKIPAGISVMGGTKTADHEDYGNYQYSDGSVMCWIPRFYYRWGHADSPRAASYGANSLDIKSIYDFADVTEANSAGYALHRAFYDNGQIKDGFFVDKYLCSNNNNIASSVKNGNPLSTGLEHGDLAFLRGGLSPHADRNCAGAVHGVKSRGNNFFVTTLFIQRALSLLSMAHAQAAINSDNCAWYDSTGIANYPKGCNNDALGDTNDTTVSYISAGYKNVAKTGSATPFAKVAHNGQENGVVDLNGTMAEVCLGVTQLSGTFYVMSTTAKASNLTWGRTSDNDAWGAAGIAANYESLGASIGALTGASRGMGIGSGTQQVFSAATSGKEWQASCAGIPLSAGVGATGTDLFGHDRFADNRVEDLCPIVGGSFYDAEFAGIWTTSFVTTRETTGYNIGMRAALYSI